MPTTVVMTGRTFAPDNSVEIHWNDGSSSIFGSIEEMQEVVPGMDNDSDLTKNLAMAWILARQPTLANIAPIQDKQFTFDMSNPQPIRVQ